MGEVAGVQISGEELRGDEDGGAVPHPRQADRRTGHMVGGAVEVAVVVLAGAHAGGTPGDGQRLDLRREGGVHRRHVQVVREGGQVLAPRAGVRRLDEFTLVRRRRASGYAEHRLPGGAGGVIGWRQAVRGGDQRAAALEEGAHLFHELSSEEAVGDDEQVIRVQRIIR
ncbi:MAG: hypothetical protein BWY76_02792 [bacterium ADurb.Bin429]|nr:MAG: hypothetical protein BWY76_02792 [bacterium ADurb.Bin429]